MTYEEFKKELRFNIISEICDKNRKVVVLEKRKNLTDRESINLIKEINYDRSGTKNVMIHEDLFCIFWYENSERKYKYWALKDLYRVFLKNGWNDVIPYIIFALSDDRYEKERSSYILRPFNYMNNTEELVDCVYWTLEEKIALVLYDIMYEECGEISMVKVSRDMLTKCRVPDKSVLWNALINTRSKMPPRLFHGDDPDYGKKSDEGIFMPGDGEINVWINGNNKNERMNGYRLTTSLRMGGAIAFFYPGVKERIADMIGTDYYVGFLTLDEVMIYPVRNHIAESLRKKVQSVNVRMDSRKVLSSSIFRYISARKELVEV